MARAIITPRMLRLLGGSMLAAGTLVLVVALGQTSGVLVRADKSDTALAAVPGRILFGHAGDIWVAEEGNLHQVTQGGRYWSQADWSPDGSRIALVGWGDNATDLFILNPDNGDIRQITQSRKRLLQESDWALNPRWSPDGDLLAFTVDRNTEYPMLWVSRPDGTAPRQLTRPISMFDGVESMSWSPDGTQVAITRYDQTTSQIHLVDVARPTAVVPMTNEPGGAFDPCWSPDGRYIAYAARSGRRTSIKVHDTTGANPPFTLVDADLARSPRWSPSGTSLAYIGLSGQDFELHVVDVTADADGRLTASRHALLTSRFGVDATAGLSWAP